MITPGVTLMGYTEQYVGNHKASSLHKAAEFIKTTAKSFYFILFAHDSDTESGAGIVAGVRAASACRSNAGGG